MSKLTKEQYEDLPDYAKEAFVQDGEEYVPVKDAKLKQTLDELDSKFKTLEQEHRKQGETLAEFEKRKQEELKAAREKALEEAENASDVKKIKEYYAEREQDIRKQEREEARKEVEKEFAERSASQKAGGLADKIGMQIGVDKDAAEALSDLIRPRIKVDPDTQEEQFFDAQGSALGVDEAGFVKVISKEGRFSRLIKAGIVTSGGGKAKGSNGSGAPVKNPFSKEHFNLSEQGRLWREDPDLARTLKSQAEG